MEDVTSSTTKTAASTCSSLSFPMSGAVSLNVGGREFITTVETLCEEAEFFRGLKSGIPMTVIPTEKQAPFSFSYFIDRDARIFEHLLKYMRTKMTPTLLQGLAPIQATDIDTLRGMYVDADFFGMSSLKHVLHDKFKHLESMLTLHGSLSDAKQQAEHAASSSRSDEIASSAVDGPHIGSSLLEPPHRFFGFSEGRNIDNKQYERLEAKVVAKKKPGVRTVTLQSFDVESETRVNLQPGERLHRIISRNVERFRCPRGIFVHTSQDRCGRECKKESERKEVSFPLYENVPVHYLVIERDTTDQA